MRVDTITADRLLEPIPGAEPAGADLRFTPYWRRLEEARRSDDDLDQGVWLTERKTANWFQVRELASQLLEQKTKDLRVAMFLLEARVMTGGFRDLSAGIQLTSELLERFWDLGLHPQPDILPGGALDYSARAAALGWLDEKIPAIVATIPITFSAGAIRNYSYSLYLSGRAIGREQDYEGEAYDKRQVLEAAKREGRSLDQYEEAVRNSPLAKFEELSLELQSVIGELDRLEGTVARKFGDVEYTPGFSATRSALDRVRLHVDILLDAKRPKKTTENGTALVTDVTRVSNENPGDRHSKERTMGDQKLGETPDLGASWVRAQSLVAAGDVDRGLAEMAQLAQRETSGRSRFQRKLLLAEICLKSRPKLARTILEELAEQVDNYKLSEWETTDVAGGVWAKLYRIYVESGESQRAADLYGRLCRLDPWQTLACSEE